MKTISSQRYRHPGTVEEKRAAKDYAVQYVVVEVEGEEYRVIIDGHHSHSAALADCVEPRWELVRELQLQAATFDVEKFLNMHSYGDDYYDVATGYVLW